MKNRSIPFGYRYENGVVIENPKESEILKMICDAYIAGQSLLEISTWLNEKAIEYMPGIVGWNKSRLMRIMEDDRYLGSKGYPAILSDGTLDAIQRIKKRKEYPSKHGPLRRYIQTEYTGFVPQVRNGNAPPP